ncbi:protein phosphatase 2C domain-containing protein [Novosphingobium sp. AP12]|uniref:protein phosphatase 2C domain-containing protein n=1 Tax=Novosphingobium sp. AP12 TaxID=1144305 RepID=UPI0002720F71|nr:protein phosphatase 2C domain-containing protein [Novosphingobium sp. AP12]EJL34995.1 hypothetical protein PMI02_00369 [Novosphingobium sp. AP12]
MLKIDIAASDGQGDVNEDAVGHHGNAAWVIDGATGIGGALLEEPSDAAWLARTANRLMAEVLAQSPVLATIEVLRTVMTRCAEALGREAVRPAQGPHELPSAAFAMVRILDGTAEFTTLADCRVAAVDDAGEARIYGVSSHEAIEAGTLQAARALLDADPAITPEALKAQLLPRLRANRQMMNREGGYWVLGTDPAAADHVWQTTIPVVPGQRFAVASDGFLRLIELFGAAHPQDLLTLSDDADRLRWLERLRALETEPDSLHRFTRVKRHDDASLVVCTWDGER